VTSSHGSREGLAGRARRTGDDGGDGGDGVGDGERDDGPELGAMRSVWLTMRDEDPPEGGLAELLAAARAKAQAMQARPTLWQRLAAGLRRPPALALATVLVLVGGAVLLVRRGMDAPVPDHIRARAGLAADPAVSATPSMGSSQADGSFAQGQTSAHPAPADERAAAKAESGGSTATPEPVAKIEAAVRHMMRPEPAPAAPAAVAPEGGHRAADAEPVVTGREGAGGFTGDTVAPPAPPPPAHVAPAPTRKAPSGEAPASAPGPEGASSSDDLAGTARSSHNAPPPADAGDVAKQAGKQAGKDAKEAKDDEATSLERDNVAATPGASPEASIAELYKQCEAAAKRGDCAAVRRMVGRIARSDRGYRARVAKDSAVGKCLAE